MLSDFNIKKIGTKSRYYENNTDRKIKEKAEIIRFYLMSVTLLISSIFTNLSLNL